MAEDDPAAHGLALAPPFSPSGFGEVIGPTTIEIKAVHTKPLEQGVLKRDAPTLWRHRSAARGNREWPFPTALRQQAP